jgi:hypothetical protein
MALEHPSSAIRFIFWIKLKHYSCEFAPVSSFRIRVEQAKIRDDMLLIISGQHGIGGRGIGDIARSGEVRFTLKNGRRLPGLSGPKRADIVAKVESCGAQDLSRKY